MSSIDETSLIERILEKIEAGNHPVIAARAAGLAESTFRNWLARGREETEGPYYTFYQRISQAEAEHESALVARVQEAANWDYKAALELLSRRHPYRWGKQDVTKLKIESDTPQEPIDVRELLATPEVRQGLRQAFSAIAALNAGATQKDIPATEENTIEGKFKELPDETPPLDNKTNKPIPQRVPPSKKRKRKPNETEPESAC